MYSHLKCFKKLITPSGDEKSINNSNDVVPIRRPSKQSCESWLSSPRETHEYTQPEAMHILLPFAKQDVNTQNVLFKGWRGDSMAQSLYCSFKEIEFSFHTHILRLTTPHNSSSRVSSALFWPLWDHTPTFIHTIENKIFLKTLQLHLDVAVHTCNPSTQEVKDKVKGI